MPDTDVVVVGGGPAGLSASVFLSKNGLETVVFDDDDTWLHYAHLFNYLGIGGIDGEAFLRSARKQADHFGTDRREATVTSVASEDEAFAVETEDATVSASYVVLATGENRDLAEDLGCSFDGDVVEVDVTMETSVNGVYATGAMVRSEEWQAIISAGDGAAAALNILSRERGDHFNDFDTPDDADDVGELLSED